MKKKLVVFSLVLALVAIAVGGTLAYFMDDDEVKNTFTIGSVEIEQIEEQRVIENGEFTETLEPFENDKQLIPVISNDTAKSDKNFQDKIVSVRNIGKNDAYVQVFVAVPSVLVTGEKPVLLIQSGSEGGWTKSETTWTATEKDILGEGESTASYTIFKYVYNDILLAKTDANTEYPVTTPAIDGVYISQYADMDVTYDADGNATLATFMMDGKPVTGFDATKQLNVYVATQAIQARGFANANAALANFGAHPWVTTP